MNRPRAALLLSLALSMAIPEVRAGEPPALAPERLTWDGPRAPWIPRRRGDEFQLELSNYGLRDPSRWPAEPATPSDISVDALAKGLKTACALWMPPSRPKRYAGWILQHSKHFGVDPLVVLGLVVTQGGCDPSHSSEPGFGLARLYPKMHLSNIKARVYRYQVFRGGIWEPRELPIPKHLFYERALKSAEANIYFTAALLRVATEMCPHNDGAFSSVPHRHPVSHVVYGDRVRDTDAEDQVLFVRRRLIEQLTSTRADLHGEFHGLRLVSPVDGAPRKLTSGYGDVRDGDRRKHTGVDFYSTWGEPVYAVADGTVTFAGVGWGGGGALNIAPEKLAARIEGKYLAKAGVYLTIDHGEGRTSWYMHMADYTVRKGQVVGAGQLIGRVGRSGIKASPAHLHFELRHHEERQDPRPFLGPLVFEAGATWRGFRIQWQNERADRRGQRPE